MDKTISDKQHAANIQNSKLGGVKTPEGKEISKFNSLKHGILKRLLSVEEQNEKETLEALLLEELNPKNLIEELLVGNIANSWIRLQRAIKAEEEKIKSILNPSEYKNVWPNPEELILVKRGFIPKLQDEGVEILSENYSRYIAHCEYQFYKAIETLIHIKSATQVADKET